MPARFTLALALTLLATVICQAQTPPAVVPQPQFRPPARTTPATPAPTPSTPSPTAPALTPKQAAPAPLAAQVTPGSGVLDNSAGQVWRDYNIAPYTSRVKTTVRPEQAIIDWILRETGTEVWFSEPLGLLSADRNTVHVYHTPEMQRIVADVIDRFVASQAESQVLSLRLVTVNSPNWRSTAQHLLKPVNVQTPGVNAWLLSKENAALLFGQLRKRNDFREHNSPNLLIHNGQSQTISRMRPRNYIRGVRFRQNVYPGHELEMGQVEEGYSLELSPLVARDGATIDAVIKCHVDQVEGLVPVYIDVPSSNAQRQRVQIQVPQMASWRLHERFRWPTDQMLLISGGVGATPGPEKTGPLGIPNPFAQGPNRAEALLFIESKGKASQAVIDAARTAAGSDTYRGRY